MIYTSTSIKSLTHMYRGNLVSGVAVALLLTIGGFALPADDYTLKLPGGGELTNEERKAIRLEMIEFDVNLRTIPSLIALEDHERVAHYFESYSEFETSENPVHRESFERAVQKLEKAGLGPHFRTIQKEGLKTSTYIRDVMIAKNRNDWSPVYRSYQLIVENCRRCHGKIFSLQSDQPQEK